MINYTASMEQLKTLSVASMSFAESFPLYFTLLMFVLGITIYSVFIFHFYRFLGRKDIVKYNFEKHNHLESKFFKSLLSKFIYVFKYFLLFPLFATFWFSMLSIFLLFLAKSQTLQNSLLVSVSLVSAIRITAYYNEDLSKDLAKMMPFALLGVFLIDITNFSFNNILSSYGNLYLVINTVCHYLLFVIVLEIILRIISTIYHMIFKKKDKNIGNEK